MPLDAVRSALCIDNNHCNNNNDNNNNYYYYYYHHEDHYYYTNNNHKKKSFSGKNEYETCPMCIDIKLKKKKSSADTCNS